MSTVEHLQAAAEHVALARVAGLEGADLAQVVTATQAVIRTAQAMLMDATAAAHADDVARGQAAASTQSWIAQTAGVSHRDAARDVKLAQELQKAPATRQAMDQPGMSPDKARVITGAMDQLPTQLEDSDRATIEADLVAKAQKHSVEDLRRAAKRSVEAIDRAWADEQEANTIDAEEKRAHRQSEFWMRPAAPTAWSRAVSCSRSWRLTSFDPRSSRTRHRDTTAARSPITFSTTSPPTGTSSAARSPRSSAMCPPSPSATTAESPPPSSSPPITRP